MPHRSPSDPHHSVAPSEPGSIDRRQILRQLALLGGAVALAGLAGCESTGSRNRVGEPIPDGPGRRPTAPLPRSAPAIARAGEAAQTGIIPRGAWTKLPPVDSLAKPMRPVVRITIHHEGSTPFSATDPQDVAARLESIRRAHRGRGWADIGYHYVIDPSGRVWEGRPLRLQGAHVAEQNEGNLGVMVLGNFEAQRPTSAATHRLDALVGECMRRYRVSARNVFTHRELDATSCPGRYLQTHVVASRSRGGAIAQA